MEELKKDLMERYKQFEVNVEFRCDLSKVIRSRIIMYFNTLYVFVLIGISIFVLFNLFNIQDHLDMIINIAVIAALLQIFVVMVLNETINLVIDKYLISLKCRLIDSTVDKHINDLSDIERTHIQKIMDDELIHIVGLERK